MYRSLSGTRRHRRAERVVTTRSRWITGSDHDPMLSRNKGLRFVWLSGTCSTRCEGSWLQLSLRRSVMQGAGRVFSECLFLSGPGLFERCMFVLVSLYCLFGFALSCVLSEGLISKSSHHIESWLKVQDLEIVFIVKCCMK